VSYDIFVEPTGGWTENLKSNVLRIGGLTGASMRQPQAMV
jgi:hypothetical protein